MMKSCTVREQNYFEQKTTNKLCSLILYPNDKTGSCTKQIIEENSDEYKFNQSRELF